jgi:hypothetical protein
MSMPVVHEHEHAAFAWTSGMVMDMQHGYMDMDIESSTDMRM